MNAMNPPDRLPLTDANWEERRNAVRYRAAGNVSIHMADEGPSSFEGRLLDISSTGFRVRHENSHLRSGQECDFLLPGSKGKARVVWNRITPEQIETGFLILQCETA